VNEAQVGYLKNYLSLIHSIQIGSGAHPASYPMGSGTNSQGYNGWGALVIPHLNFSVKVKNTYLCIAIPPIPYSSCVPYLITRKSLLTALLDDK
jgi:hypothetical protein